jgi:hypothetical protein
VTAGVSAAIIDRAADLYRIMDEQGALDQFRDPDYVVHCSCGHPGADHATQKNSTAHMGKCAHCRCGRRRKDMAYHYVHQAVMASRAQLNDTLRKQRVEDYAARPKEPAGPGDWSVRISDVGGCGRWIWYRNLPPEDYVAVPKFSGEARAGEVIEAAVRLANSREFQWREFQRPVRVKGIPRQGLIDEYDRVRRVPIDQKTAGEWKWGLVSTHGVNLRNLADTVGPILENLKQLLLYALGLEEEGLTPPEVILHYIKRDTLEEILIPVPWDDQARVVAEDARAELIGRLGQLDFAQLTGTPIDRDRRGPSDPLCKRCDALEHCWNVPAAEAAGRTPESYTQLGEHPDAVAIAYACEQIVLTRLAKKAAEEEYEAARRLLDPTVPAGVYLNYGRVKQGSHGYRIQYSDYAKALFEAAQERGVDLSDVPVPRGGPSLPVADLVAVDKRADREQVFGTAS